MPDMFGEFIQCERPEKAPSLLKWAKSVQHVNPEASSCVMLAWDLCMVGAALNLTSWNHSPYYGCLLGFYKAAPCFHPDNVRNMPGRRDEHWTLFFHSAAQEVVLTSCRKKKQKERLSFEGAADLERTTQNNLKWNIKAPRAISEGPSCFL